MPYDPYTGKPVDRASDLLPRGNGTLCEIHGTECIDRCPQCGAPQCCPTCCDEAMAEIHAAHPTDRSESDGE